jgi:hypothetical protein
MSEPEGPRIIGRPSKYTDELAEEICDRIAKGESIKQICADKESGWLPGESTVYRWLAENEGFRERYAHAREAQADGKFDQAWEIAHTATAENVQVARLQVDTIKWQAAKLAPKKYGDSLKVEGAVGVTVNIKRFTPEPAKPDDG